ncbi:unnamed protein product [Tenebrio molitor]|nr:unnamed protein product [Tenebrio molitor]
MIFNCQLPLSSSSYTVQAIVLKYCACSSIIGFVHLQNLN